MDSLCLICIASIMMGNFAESAYDAVRNVS